LNTLENSKEKKQVLEKKNDQFKNHTKQISLPVVVKFGVDEQLAHS